MRGSRPGCAPRPPRPPAPCGCADCGGGCGDGDFASARSRRLPQAERDKADALQQFSHRSIRNTPQPYGFVQNRLPSAPRTPQFPAMQALDAALAFAITMLILAMVVTTLVETLHRLFGLREKGLAILLGNFYDRILSSRSGGVLGAPTIEDGRRAFIEMMTINRGPVGTAPMTALNASSTVDVSSEDRKFLNWIWSGRRLGSLSLTAFMERLGGSEYGAHARHAGEHGRGERDRVGAQGRRAEVRRLRRRSVGVFRKPRPPALGHRRVRARVRDQRERDCAVRDVHEAARRHAVGDRTRRERDEELRKPAAASEHAQGIGEDATTTRKRARAVQKAADEAAAAVESLQSVGVPIGWNTQSLADFRRSRAMSLLGLFLGGLLIGLGGPFWYKAVQTLTGVRSLTRRDKGAPSRALRLRQRRRPRRRRGTEPGAEHTHRCLSRRAWRHAHGRRAEAIRRSRRLMETEDGRHV